MAKDPSVLTSTSPTAIVPAQVHIGHVQLRDLIICPRERGVVNYVQHQSIAEHNLNVPDSQPRTLAELSFTPNALTSLSIPGTNDILLAAGGQEGEIHLSYHAPVSSRHRRSSLLWQYECPMGGSINNSVLLTSLNLTRSNESKVEPRVGISNNDCTVKFYDVPIRGQVKRSLHEVGSLRLDVPVNHSSISSDGRTLLSVGDSSKVYLHRIVGGARITFQSIATISLPSPDLSPLIYPSSSLVASFSTAFSSDGLKFAVASQEGVLVVWDVRSTKPLKVFQTDKTRMSGGNASPTGWLSDDPYAWTRGHSKAPGWSARSVKFGNGGASGSGKEIMAFTEHTSLLHVIDARTFEREEIIRVPTVPCSPPPQPPLPQSRPQSQYQYQQRPLLNPIRHTSSILSPSNRLNSASPPRYVLSGASPRRPASQSQPHIVQALGDTFRIPSAYSPPSSISDSTWRALRLNGPTPGTIEEDLYNEILVIPPLGDREVESDVQALLGNHGIRARRQSNDDLPTAAADEYDANTGSAHGDYEYNLNNNNNGSSNLYVPGRRGRDDDMEVDELESDCISSHTPSRSSSPSPSTHVPAQGSPVGSSGRLVSPASGASRARSQPQEIRYDDDLDLAGTCFDPSGGFLYVASTEGVAEWSVRGAEKRWWFENGWA